MFYAVCWLHGRILYGKSSANARAKRSEHFWGNYILNFFLFFLLHSTVLSASQYVGSTAPTVLPIRKAPLVLVYDPLDNHEIAFGVVHFALRCFP